MTNLFRFAALWWCGCCLVVSAQDSQPRVLDDRLKLELFAEHPQLVTPTGIDVDTLGRVWVLESNTHFPPDGYQGHSTDRLLVLQDTNGDGRADEPTVFADGFKFAMSVAVQPVWLELVRGYGSAGVGGKENDKLQQASSDPRTPGPPHPHTVFVATRGEIVVLRDTNGDLKADERTRIVQLDTPGNYPHNGLAGLAFDALGWMYFGFGENLGADYKLIGSDGVTLSGGGEGGNVYRCRPDGSKLQRWATGFWNPHASCIDAFGRLFTVDNDPDSRPPCRLLHVVEGGDYGYRFRNGRRGTHPFTAWNGEIPGTLPMVSGTGEAPSGIVAYESDGFPADYLGTLLVGSWGDHRIDQFVLEPHGASFVSKPKPIVQGNENFRPVGLAIAPDGSLYFSDWVLRDYKLHRKGRVWRLSAKDGRNRRVPVQKLVHDGELAGLILKDSAHLSERRLSARFLAMNSAGRNQLAGVLRDPQQPSRARVEALWALVTRNEPDVSQLLADHKQGSPIAAAFDEVATAFLTTFDTPPVVAALEKVAAEETEPNWFVTGLSRATVDQKSRFDFGLNLVPMAAFETLSRESAYLHGPAQPRESTEEVSDPFLLSSLITAVANGRGPADFGTANGPQLYYLQTPLGMALTRDCCMVAGRQQIGIHPKVRLIHLLAAKRRQPLETTTLRLGLTDPSTLVRRAAIQWVGESRLNDYRWLVEHELHQPDLTPEMLMACLATLSLLDGVPPAEFEKTPPTAQMLKIVNDDQRPAALRAIALRSIPAATPELSLERLLAFTKSDDVGLKTEAVRTLQQAPRPAAIPVLLALAADESVAVSLRADALAGLCATPHDEPLPADVESFLLNAVHQRLRLRDPSDGPLLQLEAIRALRGRALPGTKIGDQLRKLREDASEKSGLRDALDVAINGKSTDSIPQPSANDHQPSPDAGRRVFYHHQGPLCFKCHTVNGRGGNVGPDLSVIARTMDRAKLLTSILEPSKEISPQYLTWTIATVDGKTYSGIVVTETGGGDLDLGDNQGKVIKIPRKEIEERVPSTVSVMPQGLHQQMTPQELADLLSYLETLK